MEDLDITPLYPEEWYGLIYAEYLSLVTDGGVIQLKKQCRVLHPSMYMTMCIRRLGHTGSHGTCEPGTKQPTLWEPTPSEKRHNAERFPR